jgi:hypothetical protein
MALQHSDNGVVHIASDPVTGITGAGADRAAALADYYTQGQAVLEDLLGQPDGERDLELHDYLAGQLVTMGK